MTKTEEVEIHSGELSQSNITFVIIEKDRFV